MLKARFGIWGQNVDEDVKEVEAAAAAAGKTVNTFWPFRSTFR